MDIRWMKHIDRLAGPSLCAALRLHQLASGGRANQGLEPPELPIAPRIGVIKFWGMGSLILAAPVFSHLRKAFPRARVVILTLRANQGIVELLGIADHALYLDLPESPAGVALAIAGFPARARSLGLDAVIDLEYLSRFSALISYLSGAPHRVGFHSWDVYRGDLHTVRRAFNPYWHVTDNFLNLPAALSGKGFPVEPVFIPVTAEEEEEAAGLLSAAGLSEADRVIAVNPNASTMALSRRWPEENFIRLIDHMVERDLGRVAVLGAPSEAAYVDGLLGRAARGGDVANLAGKSSLRGLVGVLRRAALLVTNDSGPLHLAGALGTPTVSFFGPETPSLFGPRGASHRVLYRGIDCSPCINIYNAKTVRCVRGRPECLAQITPEEALEAVTASLSESRPQAGA